MTTTEHITAALAYLREYHTDVADEGHAIWTYRAAENGRVYAVTEAELAELGTDVEAYDSWASRHGTAWDDEEDAQ